MRPRLSHSAVIKPKGQELLAEQNTAWGLRMWSHDV
jgi:hypothetical protein